MRFPLKEQSENCFDRFNFFENNFGLAVRAFSVSELMWVLVSNLTVLERHLISECYIFAYGFALGLGEATVQGEYELALCCQRIYILFLEHHPIALASFHIVEKCRVYVKFVCPKMYIAAYRIPSFCRFKHQINAMLNGFLCPNQHGVSPNIQLTVPSAWLMASAAFALVSAKTWA